MSTKHTPEPWECDTAGQPVIINGPQREGIAQSIIAVIYDEQEPALGTDPSFNYDEETAAANARRIVACVNACAGISDDDLADLTLHDLGAVRKQRHELLAVLQEALPRMEQETDGDAWTIAAHMRAAIAKAAY